jgi:hypothetical protein
MQKTRFKAMHQAVSDVHRAQRMLSSARRRLADATRNDAPHVLVAPKYAWAHAAAHILNSKLRGKPGFVSCAIGRVVRRGMPTATLCLTIFVDKKLPWDHLQAAGRRAFPKSVKVGKRRLPTDIVAVGHFTPHVLVGTSLGPAATTVGISDEGTIGAFAIDFTTRKIVAITAMHVMRIREFPNGGTAPRIVIPSPLRNEPVTPLGTLVFGTSTGIDAAKIALDNADDAALLIPGIGRVAGWRPATFPGDENASVRLAGSVSGVTHGAIIHVDVPVPEAGIEGAILADIPSRGGDSGAPLLDSQNHILGFLAGELTGGVYNNLRVFSPVATVLSVLQCDIEGVM